jgi:hypothetical protein
MRERGVETIRERLLALPERGLECRKCHQAANVSIEERMVMIYDLDFAIKASIPVWYTCTSATCQTRGLINPIAVDYFPASPIQQVIRFVQFIPISL